MTDPTTGREALSLCLQIALTADYDIDVADARAYVTDLEQRLAATEARASKAELRTLSLYTPLWEYGYDCNDYEAQEIVGAALQEREALRSQLSTAEAGCDSRQRSIETLGLAISKILPDFRASGTGEEHSAKVAEALLAKFAAAEAEREDLRAAVEKLRLGYEILAADAVISSGRARELHGMSINDQRALWRYLVDHQDDGHKPVEVTMRQELDRVFASTRGWAERLAAAERVAEKLHAARNWSYWTIQRELGMHEAFKELDAYLVSREGKETT